MLGLEDPFSRTGASDSLDSVFVPEMVDITRRQLLQAEREAFEEWNSPAAKEDWRNPVSPPDPPATNSILDAVHHAHSFHGPEGPSSGGPKASLHSKPSAAAAVFGSSPRGDLVSGDSIV